MPQIVVVVIITIISVHSYTEPPSSYEMNLPLLSTISQSKHPEQFSQEKMNDDNLEVSTECHADTTKRQGT